MTEDIVIRDMIHGLDEPFIIDSWLNSYYDGAPFTEFVRRGIYNQHHKTVVLTLIAKSEITLAVYAADPQVIVGYVVYENDTLHYLYVKSPFRRLGVAKKLLSETKTHIGYCSHLTSQGRRLQLKMAINYRPYF